MSTLYELSNAYNEFMRIAEESDLDADVVVDTLESIVEPINDKVESIAKLIKHYEGLAEQQEKEAKRLSERAKRNANCASELKSYVANCLSQANIDKVEGKLFTWSFRRSTSVYVDNLEELPKEYVRETVSVSADKKLIGDALKNGIEIKGAKLIENRNIQLK